MEQNDNIKTPGPLMAGFLKRLSDGPSPDPLYIPDEVEAEDDQRVDGFPWTENQAIVINDMIDAAQRGGLIVLCGPRGAGKTSMAREVQRRIGLGTFELAQDYFEAVALLVQGRQYKGREEALGYRGYRVKTRILILDEIHLVGCDPVGSRVLQDLIIRRHSAGRPTILITNAKPEKVDLDDSILDRAKEAGGLFHVRWDSFRGGPR